MVEKCKSEQLLMGNPKLRPARCGTRASLGKADEFRVSGEPICADSVGLESILHICLSRLIKVHASLLHNLENLGFARIIQAGAAVARLNISAEIESIAREARVDVVGEAGG
jgi:hypothetical protein